MEKNLYIYEGPVMQFNRIIQDSYRCGSQACSEAKALSNIMFSFKKKAKMDYGAKIELDKRYLRMESVNNG